MRTRVRAPDVAGAVALLLSTVTGLACREGEPAPAAEVPAFELEDVVRARLARFATPGPAADVAPEETSSREDLEPILGPLRSSVSGLRALAIEDARRLSPQMRAGLAAVLADTTESSTCRSGVAEILADDAGPAALEALLGSVESAPEAWLRAHCAHQLGRAGRDRVLPRLVLRLKYERNREAVFWIADALTRYGHMAGVESMLAVWSETDDATLRARCEQRLVALAAEHDCADPGTLLQRWRGGTLVHPGAPLAPTAELEAEAWGWIARLGEWDLRRVDDARFVLSRLEAWIVPALSAALHESAVHVRIHAAQCLERMGPRAVDAASELEAALGEPRTAPAAAAALGALGSARAVGALELCLERSRDPELRVAAAAALGALASPDSLALLRTTFERDPALDLKQALAQALIALEDAPDALSFLLACLEDPASDAGAAELALGRWLERKAALDPALDPLRERWHALDPAPGELPDDDAFRSRRRARAALVRECRPGL